MISESGWGTAVCASGGGTPVQGTATLLNTTSPTFTNHGCFYAKCTRNELPCFGIRTLEMDRSTVARLAKTSQKVTVPLSLSPHFPPLFLSFPLLSRSLALASWS
eukprot:3743896-Rhodomonas_salina.1